MAITVATGGDPTTDTDRPGSPPIVGGDARPARTPSARSDDTLRNAMSATESSATLVPPDEGRSLSLIHI